MHNMYFERPNDSFSTYETVMFAGLLSPFRVSINDSLFMKLIFDAKINYPD